MDLEKESRLRNTLNDIAGQAVDAQSAAEELDSELGRNCAIMISDFSSFLGLSREKGIATALTMVEKSHKIAEPILAALGGEVLRADPAGLVVLFANPVDAVMAARAVSRTFNDQNSQDSEGEKLSICLGIGFGRLLITEQHAYGEQAIIASRLGEAVEGSFEVRLTPEAYEGVKHLESLSFSEAEQVRIAGDSITPYKLDFGEE